MKHLLILLALFAASATAALADTVKPAAITDLTIDATGRTSVVLIWTATGDDGTTGTATSYDIRVSSQQITEQNWAGATHLSGEPTPQASGNQECFAVTGLGQCTPYYFAIKVSDEVPNISDVSNSPTTTTHCSGNEVSCP